jgi:hypothetical protein
MADGEDFNGKVIEEFRANGGKVGGWFEGAPLLLLHHEERRAARDSRHPARPGGVTSFLAAIRVGIQIYPALGPPAKGYAWT